MHIAPNNFAERERVILDSLRRAGWELFSQRAERDSLVCRMFGAKKIHQDSSIMAHGWERAVDCEIREIVAGLVTQRGRISTLEIGAGTTWGTGQRNFGVPGLARTLKQALPTQSMVSVSDRACGYDIFFVRQAGELVRIHYRDDRPPQLLSPSPMRADGTFMPSPPALIAANVAAEPEFAEWIAWHEKHYGVELMNGTCPLFIRPELDAEVESRLFGVRVIPESIDYLNLVDSLERAGELARYDLVFGRHLLPQYLPSRIERLRETLPEALVACARNAYVQFDRCFFGDDDYADLVFQHHEIMAPWSPRSCHFSV